MHGGFGKTMEGAPPPHWLGHVHVEDVDETIAKVERAGGELAAGPFDMPEVGRMGIVADPQGAFLGVYQPDGDAGSGEGVFVWDELGTTDVDGAQRFYEAVFGWTARELGPEYGGYRIVSRGETDIAGLMTNPDESMPARWQPYVAVDDPDAITGRAKELGGSALMEPMDVPNVGRIAVLRDPQGATFGVIRPQPAS